MPYWRSRDALNELSSKSEKKNEMLSFLLLFGLHPQFSFALESSSLIAPELKSYYARAYDFYRKGLPAHVAKMKATLECLWVQNPNADSDQLARLTPADEFKPLMQKLRKSAEDKAGGRLRSVLPQIRNLANQNSVTLFDLDTLLDLVYGTAPVKGRTLTRRFHSDNDLPFELRLPYYGAFDVIESNRAFSRGVRYIGATELDDFVYADNIKYSPLVLRSHDYTHSDLQRKMVYRIQDRTVAGLEGRLDTMMESQALFEKMKKRIAPDNLLERRWLELLKFKFEHEDYVTQWRLFDPHLENIIDIDFYNRLWKNRNFGSVLNSPGNPRSAPSDRYNWSILEHRRALHSLAEKVRRMLADTPVEELQKLMLNFNVPLQERNGISNLFARLIDADQGVPAALKKRALNLMLDVVRSDPRMRGYDIFSKRGLGKALAKPEVVRSLFFTNGEDGASSLDVEMLSNIQKDIHPQIATQLTRAMEIGFQGLSPEGRSAAQAYFAGEASRSQIAKELAFSISKPNRLRNKLTRIDHCMGNFLDAAFGISTN